MWEDNMTTASGAEPALPSIQLLEAMHEFPTMFVFKAIGDFHADFVPEVLTQVTAALTGARRMSHRVRMSAAGNHAAVNVEVECFSALEVHDVYRHLLKVPGLRALF